VSSLFFRPNSSRSVIAAHCKNKNRADARG
jgi:hypothetical protein